MRVEAGLPIQRHCALLFLVSSSSQVLEKLLTQKAGGVMPVPAPHSVWGSALEARISDLSGFLGPLL